MLDPTEAGGSGLAVRTSECQAGGLWFRSQHPTSAETRMWGRRLATKLALYTDKGGPPEVNTYHVCMCQSSNKASHSGFETQRRSEVQNRDISVKQKLRN